MQDEDTQPPTGTPGQSGSHGPPRVHRWGRWEGRFESRDAHGDPVHTVEMRVELAAPSGTRHTAPAFWDGDRTWRVRFCPDEIGMWTYATRCEPADPGLEGQTGAFTCVPYEGDNPLYRHGVVEVAPSGHYLAHADGTPFFYLADTCWNGPM